MKTSEKTFDSVKFMRQQRDKLSEKPSKMTKEEIVEYFKKGKTTNTIKPSAEWDIYSLLIRIQVMYFVPA